MHDTTMPTDRRTLLKGAAAGAVLLAPAWPSLRRATGRRCSVRSRRGTRLR
jgi:hypothetical protein